MSEENFDGKKNVSFSEKNEVREFSSQESTDVEIVSASDEADDNQSQARISKSRKNQIFLKNPQKSPLKLLPECCDLVARVRVKNHQNAKAADNLTQLHRKNLILLLPLFPRLFFFKYNSP